MQPILQFGTSRFLQAHADLFIDEALARGQALGRITVVQTTASSQSARRIAAINAGEGYPVRIRGLHDGVAAEHKQRVHSLAQGLDATRDWPDVIEQVAGPVRVILSNTGDAGYALDPYDQRGLLDCREAPRSFPAKLLVLLYMRYRRGAAPLTLMPCELVANNGSVLRDVVLGLAKAWEVDQAFIDYVKGCVWANSLVDRIVSEAIEPLGAVAEPYALWAVERQPGMVLPCEHPAIVLTDSLEPYERRKLFLLNLGHTLLAGRWLQDGRPNDETVLQAMSDRVLRQHLETAWEEEVLPVLDTLYDAAANRAYLAQVRERFANPYLAHRLADIAQHHAEKTRRRVLPVVELAGQLGLTLPQPRLRAALRLA